MKWLSNIKTIHKLYILLALPTLALLIFGAFRFQDNYVHLNTAYNEEIASSLIEYLDEVEEALIYEWSLSILYLKDNQSTPNTSLQSTRETTDKKINILEKEVKNSKIFLNNQTASELFQPLFIYSRELPSKRNLINGRNISLDDLNYYFEGFNNKSLAVSYEIYSYITDLEVAKIIYHYLLLRQEINQAAVEEEVIEIALAEGKILDHRFLKLLKSINIQDSLREAFLRTASPLEREIYEASYQSDAVTKAVQMRKQFLSEIEQDGFSMNIERWLNTQNEKITTLDEAAQKLLKEAKKEALQLVWAAEKNLVLLTVVFLAIVIISFFLATAILRNIINPLENSVLLAKDVGQGKLDPNFDLGERYDEFGTLEHANKEMINSLIELTDQLKNEITTLSNSSKDILSSVNDISTATSETATAVNETTTTVEELKQTGQVSSEKAKNVLQKAEESLNTLKSNEAFLHATINDMNLIEERMVIISESIVKLSEHSQAIGRIIDTVNDLAEQSNLLAVNAAIEAAKAGEQGKGFAIVAQEVRSLAEQSKQATHQVHSILNDIQNATSAAVMATEQGSKAVAKGVEQSSNATQSIQDLSQGMNHVTQAASQIAVSSEQQAVGVNQVNLAMGSIKEASNQHLNNMRQVESSVKELNKVGNNLERLAKRFQIKGE